MRARARSSSPSSRSSAITQRLRSSEPPPGSVRRNLPPLLVSFGLPPVKIYFRSHLTRHRRLLVIGSMIVVLSSLTTLALASRRRPACARPWAGRCVPTTLTRSAVLPGTSLAVTPLPDSYDALPRTQISLLGAPPHALTNVTVKGSISGRHDGHLKAYSQGDGASFVPEEPFLSGETVTVTGRVAIGVHPQPFGYHL